MTIFFFYNISNILVNFINSHSRNCSTPQQASTYTRLRLDFRKSSETQIIADQIYYKCVEVVIPWNKNKHRRSPTLMSIFWKQLQWSRTAFFSCPARSRADYVGTDAMGYMNTLDRYSVVHYAHPVKGDSENSFSLCVYRLSTGCRLIYLKGHILNAHVTSIFINW
jgi:hypothetical protein